MVVRTYASFGDSLAHGVGRGQLIGGRNETIVWMPAIGWCAVGAYVFMHNSVGLQSVEISCQPKFNTEEGALGI